VILTTLTIFGAAIGMFVLEVRIDRGSLAKKKGRIEPLG
jgi:hypothetical protein